MATINKTRPSAPPVFTFEGGKARELPPRDALRRAVLSCLLWEGQFYESGEDIANRIHNLVTLVVGGADLREPADRPGNTGVGFVEALAVEARNEHHLRHAPLWLATALVNNRKLRAGLIPRIVNRADELAELLAMYWKDGKHPMSNPLRKGLALAFTKFDAYQLAKYDRDSKAVRIRDVMFLTHPTAGRKGYTRVARRAPSDVHEAAKAAFPDADVQTHFIRDDLSEQEAVWAKLAADTLESPDTWEVGLSGGADKRETFERLIREKKLGGLATLRNLRNMVQSNVDTDLIKGQLAWIDSRSGILPYQFVTAARYAPSLEPEIEQAMLRAVQGLPKIAGKTVLLVDVSGSMDAPLSERGEMTRMDAACGLAILARHVCEDVRIFTFSNSLIEVPIREGFALRDAIVNSQKHTGTLLGAAVRALGGVPPEEKNQNSWNRADMKAVPNLTADRLIVFTDEQAHDEVGAPPFRGYMVNVASADKGVNFGAWTGISGFSEATLNFIRELEPLEAAVV